MTAYYSFRNQYNGIKDEDSATLWPYRTTPLVLPGAKVKKDSGPTECYLRHHPNPAMRASPHSVYDHHDVLMKQKVADTVLHRVAGEEAANKVVHKQFNSPIGLYSEANIADTIRRDTGSVPLNGSLNRPQKSKSYKRTVLYDPAKSETYRALQEESYGDNVEEVAVPVQTRVFQPNRIVPGKKPLPSHPAPQPQQNIYANSLGTESEQIHQSGSFKRLMYHVLGETDY